ncbi:MAG: FecR domain-containing protein [Myxococcales bacterium]|nr:FecR domain-containing protein [Myxococcales bacterium]
MTDTNQDVLCAEVEEHMAEILDGSAADRLYDHVADCDRCRDARHDAEALPAMVADAALDYEAPADLETRVLAELDRRFPHTQSGPVERAPEPAAEAKSGDTLPSVPAPEEPASSEELPAPTATEEMPAQTGSTPARTEDVPARTEDVPARTEDHPGREEAPPPVREPVDARPRVLSFSKRRRWLIAGGAGALVAAAAAAIVVMRSGGGVGLGESKSAWRGAVQAVSGPAGGLKVCDPEGASCTPLSKDGEIGAGSVLVTDGSTRAHVELADGTQVVLDRATRLSLTGDESRRAKLESGALVADVAHVEGQTARFDLPKGHVEVLGTKLALSVVDDSATVDVSRGVVKLTDENDRSVEVRAGEEGRVVAGAPPFVSSAPALGEALAWSESTLAEDPSEEATSRGLGQLSAKKPGEKQERAGAVTLTAHSVKVRIAGAMARTEVDETFTNTTNDVLEGIYRFPIPPDAKIERLALEVDGKMEEGAFVDRERAAAIWRGAIVNAAPQIRREIKDEIVWVPGPWRDPALLEWQRGGRFELRIYPIPKKGSRRVVLAYTQVIHPTGGVRRYSYPLAHDPSGSTRVDKFDVDIQVRGNDPTFGVKSRGYELSRAKSGDADELSMHQNGFSPSGDLTVEYALANRDAELTAWAYQPPASEKDKIAKKAGEEADAHQDDAYVALALRPKLPRAREAVERTVAVVVDSSRSMYGESYRRATAVASKTIRELDRRDHFTLLACDTECQVLPGGVQTPSAQAAVDAKRFLEGIAPEGASDVTQSIAAARKAVSGANGELRIVYIGDGTPTVGEIRPAYVTRAVERAVPPGSGTVTTVAVGADSDLDTLDAVARGGGGVVLPFVPGQTTAEAAYAVLGATYGTTLRDVVVELPPGLTEVAPKRVGSILAGSEELVVARMDKSQLDGTVVVRGKLGKESFEQRYPLKLAASESKGNAFVPRLFAATRIQDLERETDADSKKEAIRLSSAFDVASRFTSLLVLESEAMFRAFGLDNTRTSHQWTGEEAAESSVAAGAIDVDDEEADAFDGLSAKDDSGYKKSKSANGPMAIGGATASGAGGLSRGHASAPMARPAPKPAATSGDFAASEAAKAPPQIAVDEEPPMWRQPRRMIPMRRIWERKGTIEAGRVTPKAATPSAIAAAERDLDQNPNRREAVKKVYTLYALAGDVERAFTTAERWSEKEPLDPEALTARADLAARSGDRDLAIRILGSVVDVRPDDVASQERLARLHRWAGRPEMGCRHSLAIAQIRSKDPKLLAEAVSCARQTGESRMADDMLAAVSDSERTIAERLVTKVDARKDDLSGDLRVEANWNGGGDVDLALLHPDGHRVSWLGAPTRSVISATDVTSTRHEGLALRGAKPGEYVVEVVRASGNGPIRGDVTITVAGTRRTLPFDLEGNRETVGIAKVSMQSRLVPVNGGFIGWRR